MEKRKDLSGFNDLSLSAFLHEREHRLIAIRPQNEKDTFVTFFFNPSTELDKSVALFYANQGSVEPRAYIRKMRKLKDMARAVCDG